MTRPKIVLVHFTPPDVIGGVEHVMLQHISLLTSHGFDVHVVAGRGDPTPRLQVLPEIDAARPENAALEAELADGVVSPRFHATRGRILSVLRPLVAEATAVIVHNAFTLHFSLPLTAAMWQLAVERPPGRVIAWCHDLAWINPLYQPFMHQGYPWELLRTPAPYVRYVTISQERRAELLGLWGTLSDSVEVIPNGVDLARFLRLSRSTLAIARRYRLLERDAVLLLPVRITRRKNVEAGIRAVASLKRRDMDVLLLVTGPVAPHHPGLSHDYLERLKALREECAVTDNVAFLADELGHNLDDEGVSELFLLADALFFPSTQEGFGLPILEAGLAHLPAIVSDIPVLKEVGGPNVWTFAPNDPPDTIADQIVHALEDRPARLHRRVLREYRWETIMQRQILPLLNGGSC